MPRRKIPTGLQPQYIVQYQSSGQWFTIMPRYETYKKAMNKYKEYYTYYNVRIIEVRPFVLCAKETDPKHDKAPVYNY